MTVADPVHTPDSDPVPVPPIVPESDLTPLRFIDIPATLFKNAVALVKRSGCEINDCSVAGCLRAAAEMANGLGYLCGSESSLTFSRLSESPTDTQGTDR